MRFVLGILAAMAGIYSLLIFVRIIFSWFGDIVSGKAVNIIKNITDPYLNWWRKTLNLRIGMIDFSAIVAIVFLSFLQYILFTLSILEGMSLGFIIAEIIISIWRIISFIFSFFLIVIILRFIAYVTNRNIYHPFWNIINSISQPVLYRMNRFIFGNKIGNLLTGIIVTLIIFTIVIIGGWLLINFFCEFLRKLPI